MLIWLAVLMLLHPLLSSTAAAETSSVVVTGRVIASDTGLPIAGTALDVKNHNEARIPGEMPRTSADGTFSITLPPESYTVGLVANAPYVAAPLIDAFTVTGSEAEPISRPDYVQVKQAVISGTVSHVWSGGVIPAEYAWIDAWPPSGPVEGRASIASTNADAEGRYSIAVPPGDYVLYVHAALWDGIVAYGAVLSPDVQSGESPIQAVSNETAVHDMTCPTVMDTTPPTVQLYANNMGGLSTQPDGERWTNGSPYVWIYAEDPPVWRIMKSISYQLDGGPVQVAMPAPDTLGRLRVDFGQFTSGDHRFDYWATDLAGNTSARRTWTVRIDKEDPTPPVGAAVEWKRAGARLSWIPSLSTDVTTYRVMYTSQDIALTQWSDNVWGVSYVDVPASCREWTHAGATVPLHYAVFAIDRVGNRSPVSLCDLTENAPAFPPDDLAIQGDDRYGTAIDASRAAFPFGADTVVIATGTNWPDALGGTALAAAQRGPILLTRPRELPEQVLAEIVRLGANRAIVLGSTTAVGPEVVELLGARLGSENVRRIGGADRYATAELVARETVRSLDWYDGTCLVATGANFPDALGASPLAAAKGWPILLTKSNQLPSSAAATMIEIGVRRVILLGGPSVISTSVEGALKAYTPVRLAGANRYETAAKVATYGVDTCGLTWNRVAIGTGEKFPDALAGGVLQAEDRSVMLMTTGASLHPAAEQALRQHKASIAVVRFIGGTSAVSANVRAQVTGAMAK